MKLRFLAAFVGWAALGVCGLPASELGDDWTIQGGEWQWSREIVPVIHHHQMAGDAAAFCHSLSETDGIWRSVVKLSHGTEEAGLWVRGDEDSHVGLLVLLGRYSEGGGFVLRSASGTVMWQDKYAPWHPYHFYVIEAIVEGDRIRVQLFDGDGQTLVSQSPWISVGKPADGAQRFGILARDGAARFYGLRRASEPLSPIVADPPNKRRLIQEENSPWLVIGPGNWMWTTGKKERLRQYANCERTWALNRGIHGSLRKWECRVKVDPGTKGAGMLVQTNAEKTQGFIVWLGGEYGAGSLQLYQYEPEVRSRWSGKSNRWHYNTEYFLRGETRKGEARVQLLEADGTTVISESPWIDVGEKYAAKEGSLAFHVWSGQAEFWGFSDATRDQSAPLMKPIAHTSDLGDGWLADGESDWFWSDPPKRTRLGQRGKSQQSVALNTQIARSQGTWRCAVQPGSESAAVGLVFQASRDQQQGFVCLVSRDGARLEDLQGKTLWENAQWTWQSGEEYVLEGIVLTDRVAMRVKTADGKTILTASPDIYVAETNNSRQGHLGLLVRGGTAGFHDWETE